MLGYYVVQIPQMEEKTSEEEEMITDESTVDLQQFVPVGGVYRIDGLQLPPQVQQINSWCVVEVSEETLHLMQSHSSELAPEHAHS